MGSRNRIRLWLAVAIGTFLVTVLVGSSSHANKENGNKFARSVVPTSAPTPPPVTRPRTVAPATVSLPSLGSGASLHGKRLFPADNPWNQDISSSPVDPNSANLIKSIGLDDRLHPDFGTVWNGAPNGISYVVVSGTQPLVPVSFRSYGGESNPGPYPVPRDAPVEGGPNGNGDRHVLIIDRDRWKLYELFSASPVKGSASWVAGSGAVFDLNSSK